MTFDEFEQWLQQNPQHWNSISQSDTKSDSQALSAIGVPPAYQEFLKRFGALCVFNYCLLGPEQIINSTGFIHSLNCEEEEISFDHLTAFCALGYDNCYLCFHNEQVVDFDPLEPDSAKRIVANTFNEFLRLVIESKGTCF